MNYTGQSSAQQSLKELPALPTLQEVMTHKRIPARVLAEVAQVEPVRVHLILLGGYVRRRHAERIVKALAQLTGYPWTCETIGGLRLYQEHEWQTSKVAPLMQHSYRV